MIKTGTLSPKNLPKTYTDLVHHFPPRVIRDEVDYTNTTEVVNALAGLKLNREQEDYLDTLAALVEAYDRETLEPLAELSPSEAVKALLAEAGHPNEYLAELLGVDRSTAFKLLKGTRNLTADHIRKLSDRFHVSADLFLNKTRG
ncbi:MAG: helix-turn-helix domain-containing protein [Opitutaceae bacterium]|nr:helix-turn-helix domain-containing protein [Opitutaceae bacterium]